MTDSVSAKAAYVRSQSQTREHTCHWTGCERQCPPAAWGCRTHWYKLPKHLRSLIWATYEIGQEVSMTPSEDYIRAAHQVQEYIDSHPDA